MYNKSSLFIILIVLYLFSCSTVNKESVLKEELPGRIRHNGQELFLSGMNLAWISYGRDLTMFNQEDFVRALDEISSSGGNCIRWWIHVNGSSTPLWDGYRVTGMPNGSLDNFERALDLAWERKILVIPTLWSFDMLQNQSQMDPVRNKKFLEDPEAVKSYLDNALTPIIERVGSHKAIVAWEVFNEPEGMVEGIGWADHRVKMESIQTFVNRVAGRIHQIDPKIKVTNGTKDMSTQTDIAGYTNYYRDDRLIAAGGDPEGILDFYEVHYYPAHMGEGLSPFHKPKSYWKLDKELIIGEFPAVGILDYGSGFKPSSTLTPEESYNWAYNMGYAGALAWTWTAHEPKFGSTASAEPGMMSLKFMNKRAIVVDNGNVDWIPVKTGDIKRLLVPINSAPVLEYVDLRNIFNDREDGKELAYSVLKSSNPELVDIKINNSIIDIIIKPNLSGKTVVSFGALDKAGNQASANLEIVVVDPDKGDIALFKPVKALSIENETHLPAMVNDGMNGTRYSSEYKNEQWITIDLQGKFTIYGALLNWEAAYGKKYRMEVSMDGEKWITVFTEDNGKEGVLEYSFDKVEASYVRLIMDKRGTDWGFSLWDFEVFGERIK